MLLIIHSAQGAQCNTAFTETPDGYGLQISHATNRMMFAYSVPNNHLGWIYEQIVTTDAVYLSMNNGERLKVYSNYTFAWAVIYGAKGLAMALSVDSAFLIAGS